MSEQPQEAPEPLVMYFAVGKRRRFDEWCRSDLGMTGRQAETRRLAIWVGLDGQPIIAHGTSREVQVVDLRDRWERQQTQCVLALEAAQHRAAQINAARKPINYEPPKEKNWANQSLGYFRRFSHRKDIGPYADVKRLYEAKRLMMLIYDGNLRVPGDFVVWPDASRSGDCGLYLGQGRYLVLDERGMPITRPNPYPEVASYVIVVPLEQQ